MQMITVSAVLASVVLSASAQFATPATVDFQLPFPTLEAVQASVIGYQPCENLTTYAVVGYLANSFTATVVQGDLGAPIQFTQAPTNTIPATTCTSTGSIASVSNSVGCTVGKEWATKVFNALPVHVVGTDLPLLPGVTFTVPSATPTCLFNHPANVTAGAGNYTAPTAGGSNSTAPTASGGSNYTVPTASQSTNGTVPTGVAERLTTGKNGAFTQSSVAQSLGLAAMGVLYLAMSA
ncbi:hypothetical protein DFP72DRAFT_1040540 [Ephemerocybe angulata]|uniref:Uncharacterized protein n=1 Tax=Ephemerocybe angulata TaxID=980116 RepID=A0A8H6MFU0_9AGAR|nr:hypothetical protein DFP72DRAFT_1040540 [Tulosesus angulatus]